MQIPDAIPVTVLPLVLPPSAQLVGVKLVKTTGNSELAVAVQTMSSSITTVSGVHDKLIMVWSSLLAAMMLVTCDAGL